MVWGYSDAGQERWLAEHGIDLLRGTGRLADSGVVEVDGVRHTAEHVVLATGSNPIVPPIPGLRESGRPDFSLQIGSFGPPVARLCPGARSRPRAQSVPKRAENGELG
jgi:Pyridine nucleotide-disulphide oxidoreductase